MSFRDQLRADLQVNRYNFTHLAAEAQITKAYLSRILTCQMTPSIHVATSLAMAANRLTNQTTYTPDMFVTITKDIDHA